MGRNKPWKRKAKRILGRCEVNFKKDRCNFCECEFYEECISSEIKNMDPSYLFANREICKGKEMKEQRLMFK